MENGKCHWRQGEGNDSGGYHFEFPFDEPEHGERNHGQKNPPDRGWDSRDIVQADFAELPDGENIRFQPGKAEGVDNTAGEHAEKSDEGVETAGRDGCHSCPRAIPVESHADPEDGAPERNRGKIGIFDVIFLNPSHAHHGEDPEASDNDRGEHDFQNGEILKPEEVDDDVVVCDPSLVEENAENGSEDGGDDQAGCRACGDRKIHEGIGGKLGVRRCAYSGKEVSR